MLPGLPVVRCQWRHLSIIHSRGSHNQKRWLITRIQGTILSGKTDSPSPTFANKQLHNRTGIISAVVQVVEAVATTAVIES
jgi:hypothetical protein